MDLGVPHNELRMLINESDENQDGIIQYQVLYDPYLGPYLGSIQSPA